MMSPKKCIALFSRFKAHNPAPATELQYTSPFELLIAVLLSAQANDKTVNKATAKLFPVANTPEKIVLLGEENLKNYLSTINFYPTKAAHIIKTCEILINTYHAQVPSERASLESLPGVGRKTANVILNTAFGEETIAVDTHIFRVANRTGLAHGKNVREVEDQLLENIPPAFKKNAHHWLVLHGRYICTAKKPKCAACFICDLCAYAHST
jgi:endonuclease-3